MVFIKKLSVDDQDNFVRAMQRSRDFHYPFVSSPQSESEFKVYLQKSDSDNNQSYLAMASKQEIVGVFNLNEIVYGVFQSAYLGYYACVEHAGKGLMSQGLKALLRHVFEDLKLHRLEANIQPTNMASLHLVAKNGFRKEGFSPRYLKLNGAWQDHFRYAMTYEDWLEKHG